MCHRGYRSSDATRGALAAVLTLGAPGAWMGTRFLMATEANIHADYLAALVRAAAADTFVATVFGVGWEDAPGRALRNSTARSWQAAGRPVRDQRPREGEVLYRSPTSGAVVSYKASTPPADALGNVEAASRPAGVSAWSRTANQPSRSSRKHVACPSSLPRRQKKTPPGENGAPRRCWS
jgi:NAD(P)H-dependent flavin oxidoreductase YrpB (nitropropane dioxygenase family)